MRNYAAVSFLVRNSVRKQEKALTDVENFSSVSAISSAPMPKSVPNVENLIFSVLCCLLYFRKMSFLTMRLCFHPVLFEIKC